MLVNVIVGGAEGDTTGDRKGVILIVDTVISDNRYMDYIRDI
jgi:hypothetical protein